MGVVGRRCFLLPTGEVTRRADEGRSQTRRRKSPEEAALRRRSEDLHPQPAPQCHRRRAPCLVLCQESSIARTEIPAPAGDGPVRAGILLYRIGRASGRERVCQYGYIPGGVGSLKKKKQQD